MPSPMTVFGALNLNARNFEVELRSPVMASTSRIPSAYRPSSRALVALRLRSRQVMWGKAHIPSYALLEAIEGKVLPGVAAIEK